MALSYSSPSQSRTHRRARSHSSTPLMSPYDSWRSSPKRLHHSQSTKQDLLSCSSSSSQPIHKLPMEKWDVDMWRRGKRPSPQHSECDLSSEGLQRQFTPVADRIERDFAPESSSRSTIPRLPSTSQQFQLFTRKSTSSSSSSSKMTVDDECISSDHHRSLSNDLLRLHTDAFNDLRKSVLESGEGLVQRMREWEEGRSNTTLAGSDGGFPPKDIRKRGRKRPSTSFSICETEGSEDSDVEIMSSISINSNDFACSNPAKRRRALSLGRIDLTLTEEPDLSNFQQESERSPSPFSHGCSASVYSSDDDDMEFSDLSQSQFSFNFQDVPATTPPLSFTFSNSANSSLMSLPLPPPYSGGSGPITSLYSRGSAQNTPKSAAYAPCAGASKSERAVAALSLALANGAGSLGDYSAVLSAQGAIAAEDRQAGELWA